MILFIALACSSIETDPPKLFQTSFGPIQEVVAKTGNHARANARPLPGLQPFVDRMFECYEANATDGRLLSIRLAINSGDRWLFVDERGIAKLDGQFGRFDVVRWELIVRTMPRDINVRRSPLVQLSIRNETHGEAKLLDSAGFVRAAVEPMSVTTTLTWFGDHKVWANGRYAGRVGRFFEAAYPHGPFVLEFRGSPDWDFDVSPMPAQIRVGNAGLQ